MDDLNAVTLSGRLAEAPRMSATPSGKTVAKLRLASSRNYQNKDYVNYFTVEVWGQKSEQFRNVPQGALVVVAGRLSVNSWTGQDGAKHNDIFVNATEAIVMGVASTMAAPLPACGQGYGYGQPPQPQQGYGYGQARQPQPPPPKQSQMPQGECPPEDLPF